MAKTSNSDKPEVDAAPAPEPKAAAREVPFHATAVSVFFEDEVPGACTLDGPLVLMPGNNDLAPKTVEALKSHPIGERCRVDGKRLREPKPAK